MRCCPQASVQKCSICTTARPKQHAQQPAEAPAAQQHCSGRPASVTQRKQQAERPRKRQASAEHLAQRHCPSQDTSAGAPAASVASEVSCILSLLGTKPKQLCCHPHLARVVPTLTVHTGAARSTLRCRRTRLTQYGGVVNRRDPPSGLGLVCCWCHQAWTPMARQRLQRMHAQSALATARSGVTLQPMWSAVQQRRTPRQSASVLVVPVAACEGRCGRHIVDMRMPAGCTSCRGAIAGLNRCIRFVLLCTGERWHSCWASLRESGWCCHRGCHRVALQLSMLRRSTR
jgi:hypothetical protein